MKFSIIIPNYNNENYLRDTIDSALAVLPDADAEIVLVDDCSTDRSWDIATEYSGLVRACQNETNLGQELTTNRGLELAQGEYAVILHSDDLLHPNFYDELHPLLDKNPSAVLAVGERDEIGEKGKVIGSPASFYDGSYLIPGVEQAKIFLLSGFLPCQVMFRREVILSYGGAKRFFVVNLDGLLWFKAALNGDIAYTQSCVSSYRKHKTSTTSGLNQSIIHLFEYYSTLKEMLNYANEMDVDLGEYPKKAFSRISELAVRYAREIYASGGIELSQRYIMMAQAIDPEIVNKQVFIDAENIVSGQISEASGATGFHERTYSYSPPSGSKPLNTGNIE